MFYKNVIQHVVMATKQIYCIKLLTLLIQVIIEKMFLNKCIHNVLSNN